MPPHLFSIADNAYNDMLVSKLSGPVNPSQPKEYFTPFLLYLPSDFTQYIFQC